MDSLIFRWDNKLIYPGHSGVRKVTMVTPPLESPANPACVRTSRAAADSSPPLANRTHNLSVSPVFAKKVTWVRACAAFLAICMEWSEPNESAAVSGESCDRCLPGFYGDLALPGARCEACPCNGNIDPADRNACNSLTGECLHCLHGTTGPQCQDCKPGYYGNALVHDCKGKQE